MQDQIERALAEIRFGPDGLVPAIAQQHDTGEILMLAWMNRDAVRASLDRRPRLLLVAVARETVAQGRDLRTGSVAARAAPRLRRRHGAAAGRSAGRRLPHRAGATAFSGPGGMAAGRLSPSRSPAGNSLPRGAKRALIGDNYVKRPTELFARGNGSAEPDPPGDLDRRPSEERPDDHCRGLRGQGQGSAWPGADRLRRRVVVRQHRLSAAPSSAKRRRRRCAISAITTPSDRTRTSRSSGSPTGC